MRTMWMVAGPNGAGKSTLTNQILRDLSQSNEIFPNLGVLGFSGFEKLNADEVTLELRNENPTADQADLNMQAAKFVDRRVLQLIDEGADFLVETVLSSPKYRDAVTKAREKGFTVGLIYVSLHPPELSPERVGERVLKGGHAVDRQTAIDRYHRSHQQLIWFAREVDELMVIDNSSANGEPVLLAVKAFGGAVTIFEAGLNPAVDQALERAFEAP